MKRSFKGVALLVIFCFLLVGMSGCASSSGGNQWSNKQRGALGGAVIGALVGLKEKGLAGALVGAAVGGTAGYMIGGIIDYVKEKDAAAVYSEYGRDNRIVLEDMQLSKNVFQGGEKGEVALKYAIIDPNPNQSNQVNHTIEYWQNGKKLTSNTDSKSVKPGGYTAKFPLVIPKGADEGSYTMVARVDAMNKSASLQRPFRVFYARNSSGSLYVASVTPY